jgi:predicted NBD/HSP70 family sugar kinase
VCYNSSMYAGVDIGATKTLVAVLTDEGIVTEKTKFETPKNYDAFLKQLQKSVAELTTKDFQAAGVAVPGRLNRKLGTVIGLGNLPWENEPIHHDAEKILQCPVVIENDAKLAALSEAMLHKNADTVLYITVSTGIGTGVVYKQQLVPALVDGEGGHILVPYHGKLTRWESFASGKAIVAQFGKKAEEITDVKTWKTIARNLSIGLFEHIAIVQPDLIIVGGSVGTHFDKFGDLLVSELKKYELPIVPIPHIIQAQRPEEAVVFGCYDLAKQVYGKHA